MRILLVDDNPQVRAAFRMCFETKKDWFVCGEAADGSSAIDLVRSLRPDVVLLDYAMPEMDGIEAAQAMNAIAPECAILMYTMFPDPRLSELALASGVRAVLSKDVNGVRSVMEALENIDSSDSRRFGTRG
jgi:DNA-binding NarL/FixJ family response regulator